MLYDDPDRCLSAYSLKPHFLGLLTAFSPIRRKAGLPGTPNILRFVVKFGIFSLSGLLLLYIKWPPVLFRAAYDLLPEFGY